MTGAGAEQARGLSVGAGGGPAQPGVVAKDDLVVTVGVAAWAQRVYVAFVVPQVRRHGPRVFVASPRLLLRLTDDALPPIACFDLVGYPRPLSAAVLSA